MAFNVENQSSPYFRTDPKAQRVLGKVGDIPSLDGLRAISILLVLIGHCSASNGFPAPPPHWILGHAKLGVQIFFVISGFLITSLLLREKEATGSISLKLFYVRRTLRIFPAFYLYFVAMAVLSGFGFIDLPRIDLVHAFTFTTNYAANDTWWTGHLWSLSVEEQFYLVWPALICVAGSRSALVCAAVVAIASPVFLGLVYLLNLPVSGGIWLWFPLVADAIAAGCVLAGILPVLKEKAWFWKAIRSRWGLTIPVLIVLSDYLRPHRKAFYFLGDYVLDLGIAYCIARFTLYPSDAVGRFLNTRPMMLLGRLSYSLYLWQQPFFNHSVLSPWTTFPLNCCCAFSMACVSYFLVERPFQRLRARFRAATGERHRELLANP